VQLLAVNFHYIRDVKPKTEIYPRTLEEFKNQIDELGRYYEFVSQDDLLNITNNIEAYENSSSKFCLITFDDNLKEQYCAYEYLEQLSIPAIFFSTTLPYLGEQVHDVHKTHEIYCNYSDSELSYWLDDHFEFGTYKFSKEQLDASYAYDSDIRKKIKLFINFVLNNQDKKKAIDKLFNEIVIDVDRFRRDLYFTKNQLKELANKGMLGTHTHSHFPLATISSNQVGKEIIVSTEYLKEITGVKIQSISYPYGRHGAVNNEVAECAKQAGMKFGLTMYRGINNIDSFKHNPLLLQRVDTNDAPYGKNGSCEYYPTNEIEN